MTANPMPPDPPPDDAAGGKPFLDHVEELRRVLVRVLVALAVGMAVVAPFAPRLFRVLQQPLARAGVDPVGFLRTIDVGGGLSLVLRVVFWGGILLAAPLIVFWLGSFVAPGLTRAERRLVAQTTAPAVGLFALGVFLGYRVTLPVAIQVMLRIHAWMGIRPEWVVTSYVSFALQLLLAFGLAFQLPVVLLLLGRLGLLRSHDLRRSRPYVVVGILVLAMFLTPPDVVTQILMAAPLLVMYEGCVGIMRLWERREKRRGATRGEERST